MIFEGFPAGSVVEYPPTSAGVAGDMGLIPGSGGSPGGGNDNPLQYSCLENSMDKCLADYISEGRKELDMTEHVFFFNENYTLITRTHIQNVSPL